MCTHVHPCAQATSLHKPPLSAQATSLHRPPRCTADHHVSLSECHLFLISSIVRQWKHHVDWYGGGGHRHYTHGAYRGVKPKLHAVSVAKPELPTAPIAV